MGEKRDKEMKNPVMNIELTSMEAQNLKEILIFVRRNAKVCENAADHLDLTPYDFLIFLNTMVERLEEEVEAIVRDKPNEGPS